MEEAADAAHSIQVERAALLCLRRSRYAAERAVCACLKRLVSEASGPRVTRERLPSARELGVQAVRTDVRAPPPMLKLMLNKRRPGMHVRVLHRAPHAGAAHLVWVRVRVHVSSGDSPSPSPARRTLPLRSRTIASRGLTSDAMTTSPMRRSRTCAPLQPQEKTAVGFWSRIAAVVAIVAYTPPIPEITRSTVTPPMVPRVLRMAPVSGTSEQSSMRSRRYLASSSMAHITSTWLMASLEERE